MRRWMLGAILVVAACTPDSELSDHELFVKYCSECHGEDGRGDESLLEGGQEVNLLVSRHIARGDRDFVYRRIANGYGQMPAYKRKVGPETLERLVALTLELTNQKETGDDSSHVSRDNADDPDDTDAEMPTATDDPPHAENPHAENPHAENPHTESADHGSTTSESRLPETRSAG